jgi:hypothetical protein
MVETYASSWLFYAVVMVLITGFAVAWALVMYLNERCTLLHKLQEERRRNSYASPRNDDNAIG